MHHTFISWNISNTFLYLHSKADILMYLMNWEPMWGFAYMVVVIDRCKCMCKWKCTKCCLSRIVEYIPHLSFTTVLQIRCFDMIQLVQEYIFSAKIYLKLNLVLLAQQKYNINIKFLNLRLFSKMEEKKLYRTLHLYSMDMTVSIQFLTRNYP